MQLLLAISRAIDRISESIGRHVAWLIVAAAVVSAGNAVIRKVFDTSSNAWLELQWWLFAAVFLLAAPWTLLHNEHIRIDVLNNRFSPRLRNVIEVLGHTFFLLPTAGMILFMSWEFFYSSYLGGEQSTNAGGLPQWPIKALIPAAFALLFIQGISELIKRVAILRGELPEPVRRTGYHETAASAGSDLQEHSRGQETGGNPPGRDTP
jgi:TRAP-type mannitol/chloroaromatic compound transport system permease small subunit